MVGTTKVKISNQSEPGTTSDFIEKRRAALERFMVSKVKSDRRKATLGKWVVFREVRRGNMSKNWDHAMGMTSNRYRLNESTRQDK